MPEHHTTFHLKTVKAQVAKKVIILLNQASIFLEAYLTSIMS